MSECCCYAYEYLCLYCSDGLQYLPATGKQEQLTFLAEFNKETDRALSHEMKFDLKKSGAIRKQRKCRELSGCCLATIPAASSAISVFYPSLTLWQKTLICLYSGFCSGLGNFNGWNCSRLQSNSDNVTQNNRELLQRVYNNVAGYLVSKFYESNNNPEEAYMIAIAILEREKDIDESLKFYFDRHDRHQIMGQLTEVCLHIKDAEKYKLRTQDLINHANTAKTYNLLYDVRLSTSSNDIRVPMYNDSKNSGKFPSLSNPTFDV